MQRGTHAIQTPTTATRQPHSQTQGLDGNEFSPARRGLPPLYPSGGQSRSRSGDQVARRADVMYSSSDVMEKKVLRVGSGLSSPSRPENTCNMVVSMLVDL